MVGWLVGWLVGRSSRVLAIPRAVLCGPLEVLDAPDGDMLSVDYVEGLSCSSFFRFALREAMASAILDIRN